MDRGDGKQLMLEIRMGLTGRGTSFAKWCTENGIKRQNARAAVLGEWTGPKARQVVHMLRSAAGSKQNANVE